MPLISLTEADKLLILLKNYTKKFYSYRRSQLFSQSGLKFLPRELATVPGGGGKKGGAVGGWGAGHRNLHPSVWSGGHTLAIDQYLTWHRE